VVDRWLVSPTLDETFLRLCYIGTAGWGLELTRKVSESLLTKFTDDERNFFLLRCCRERTLKHAFFELFTCMNSLQLFFTFLVQCDNFLIVREFLTMKGVQSNLWGMFPEPVGQEINPPVYKMLFITMTQARKVDVEQHLLRKVFESTDSWAARTPIDTAASFVLLVYSLVDDWRSWHTPSDVSSRILNSPKYVASFDKEQLFEVWQHKKCMHPGCRRTAKLRVCSRCKVVRYCCDSCQKGHWAVHKRYCHRIAQLPRSTTEPWQYASTPV